jgi:hypothetical protein
MEVEVYDNFLTPSYFSFLKNGIESSSQPWFFTDKRVDISNNIENSIFNRGFSFWIFKENYYCNEDISKFLIGLLLQIQDKIGCSNIVRSRLDMTTGSGVKYMFDPHIDLFIKNKTTIFYFTDSDGETILFDRKIKSNSEMISAINEVKNGSLSPTKLIITVKNNQSVLLWCY